MATAHNPPWIKEMKLSREEIATLEKYVNLIEKADKTKVDFVNSGGSELMFTPGAMLVIAVVRFAYEVYRDYGALALDPVDFEHGFKDVVKSLHRLESFSADNPSLDIYAKIRRDLAETKGTGKKA